MYFGLNRAIDKTIANNMVPNLPPDCLFAHSGARLVAVGGRSFYSRQAKEEAETRTAKSRFGLQPCGDAGPTSQDQPSTSRAASAKQDPAPQLGLRWPVRRRGRR